VLVYVGGADRSSYICPLVKGSVFNFCLSYYPPGRYDDAWKKSVEKMLAAEKDMVYYSSSSGGGDTHVIVPALRAGDINNLCVSYYYKSTWEKTTPEAKKEVRLFVDSGAFSYMNQLLVKRRKFDESALHTYLEGYVAWINEIRPMVDGCVTFDYLPEAPLTRKMTVLLRKKYKLDTIPVYHGDAGLDVVRRYADEGVKKLCLSKRNFLKDRSKLPHYYDQCFNLAEKLGLLYHGLACTGPELFRYPWDSVDSTSLIRTSFLGGLYMWSPGKKKLQTVQISNKADHATEIHGVSAEDLVIMRKDYRARITHNARVFTAFCASKSTPKPVRRLF